MSAERHLGEFLTADRILVPLRAETYTEAVAALLERLERAEVVRDRAALDALVAEEERRGLPHLGDRILFPHYRTEAVAGLSLALGVAKTPFPFAPEEASRARTVVLVVAPREATGYYLKVVAALARLFRDIEVVEAIEQAPDATAIAQLPALNEIELTPELVVRDLMTRAVVSVGPETPITEVGRRVIEHRLRAVPVVDAEGHLVGVVTDREVMEHFLPRIRARSPAGVVAEREVLARDVMRRSILAVSEDQSIADVTALMVNKDIARVPVLADGKLVGFLSRGDIIRKLLEQYV
ncbi:MAG: CBS domain-containing protein [Gemmatimonadota bacterium]